MAKVRCAVCLVLMLGGDNDSSLNNGTACWAAPDYLTDSRETTLRGGDVARLQ